MRVIEMLGAAIRRLRDRLAVRRLEKVLHDARERHRAMEAKRLREGGMYDPVLGRWVGIDETTRTEQ